MTEEKRKELEAKLGDVQKLRKNYGYMIGSAILGLLIVVLSLVFMGDAMMVGVFGMFFGFVIMLGPSLVLMYKARSKYKNEILPEILKAILGDDITYTPNKGYDLSLLRSLGFFPCTTYKGEDYLTGTYKGIKFSVADIKMTHTTTNGEHTETVVDFQGSMWMFTFDCKRINSRIDIMEKSYTYNAGSRKLEKVEFEDIEFNDKFRVRTSDDHDAFYVITPPVILRLKQNISSIPGRSMYSIQGKQLFLVNATSEPHFEFKPSKMKDIASVIASVENDIEPIKETIDIFDLTSTIFKTETPKKTTKTTDTK